MTTHTSSARVNGKSDRQAEQGSRIIKVFLATPSDLSHERIALTALIRDVNDVLTFLAPERRLTIELVRYETHAFPDIGQPQAVINRQIPLDYDVLIGAMWRRCGTPTQKYDSGTVEEFWRAYEHRAKHGTPVTMFYFCEQLVPIPNSAELEQLKGVVSFREKVALLGYTISYQAHEDFREVVRPGLLRAIRSLLVNDPVRTAPDTRIPLEAAPVDADSRHAFEALARQYNEIRVTMKSGPERTRRMTSLFSEMQSLAASVSPLLVEFQNSRSDGERLGAVAILHVLPSAEHLDWLAERLDPKVERPFVGYQAAIGLLQAVRSLPTSDFPALKLALDKALELGRRNQADPDRINVLDTASRELQARS